jgi:hypothetical protein
MNSSKENSCMSVKMYLPNQSFVLMLGFLFWLQRSPFLVLLSTFEFLSSMETTLTFPQEDPGPYNRTICWHRGRPRVQLLQVHQQTLTTGPFGNTCEADAVSPEVAIGGCRTQVSTTRGNAKWIQDNNTQQSRYSLPLLSYFTSYISYDLTQQCNNNISDGK